jgi:gliding motility-associated-like protein
MLNTLLHKILLTTLLILTGGWVAVAQQYVVKGDVRSFKVEANENYLFHWSVYNKETGKSKKLASTSNESRDILFDQEGTFEVRVRPEDKGTHCFGEQVMQEVVVAGARPTAVFAQTDLLAICAESNGSAFPETARLRVDYTGPKPWTFKYSYESRPAEQPENADVIWEDFFEFELSISNTNGRTKTVEILLLDAQTLTGIPVEDNPDKQRAEVKVFSLPIPEFKAYSSVRLINTSETYVGVIGKNSTAEAFVSAGGTITNSRTELSADGKSKEVTIDVQWGSTSGNQQVMLVERSAMGCYSDTLYANVKLDESFNVSLGKDLAFCEGESAVLKPTVNLEGDYSYEWSDGSTGESLEVSDPGKYSVTVKDSDSGIAQTTSINVTVWEKPKVDLGEDYLLADGEVKVLDAGNAGATYDWSTGETSRTIEVRTPETYSVTVTNSNGCSARDEILLYNVFAIELGKDREICADQQVVLDPKPNIDQKYSYLWSNGATTSTLAVNETGDYSVTVTDESGNQQTDKVHVEVYDLPIVDMDDVVYVYEGETVELDAGYTEDKVTYLWNTDATTRTITVSEAGTYSCTVTNAFGCTNRDVVNVVSKVFTIDLGPDKEGCMGERIYLEPELTHYPVGTDANYLWSTNSTQSGIFVAESGEYCVKVTDPSGISEEDCVVVTLNPSPQVDLGPDLYAEEGEVVQLDAKNPNSFYNWYRSEDPNTSIGVEQLLEVTQQGEYSVMVTNDYNCIGSDTVNVEFEEKFELLPTGFTPNGDFQNDKLRIKEEYRDQIAKMSLIIVNRLGHKVFQSNSVDVEWDGTYRGQMQDMDTYVYILKVTFKNNKSIVKRGNVTLLH